MNLNRTKRRYAGCGLLLVVALGSLVLTACGPGNPPALISDAAPSAAPPAQAEAKLEAVKDNVWLQSQTNKEQVFAPSETAIQTGDRVQVEQRGQAWLRFADALLVKLYRDGDLEITGIADPGASSADRIFLRAGAAIVESGSPQALAESRVRFEVETDGAIIHDIGTRFLVYYDTSSGPLRHFTWVVVQEGSVEVADKAGNKVQVEAGQQTWVEPDKAPASPIPATRAALEEHGLDFPRIEAISDDAERDSAFLTPAQEEQKSQTATSTPTVKSPTKTPTPTPLPTNTPTPTPWPTDTPTPTFSPTEIPTEIPVEIPTETPTDTPTDTPTPTPSPTDIPKPADTTGPEFQSKLLYDPNEVYYYPGCGGSKQVEFSIQVDDPSGVKSVVMDYLYQSGDTQGPKKSVEMIGQAPFFSVTIDVGQEAFNEFKDGDGALLFWIGAVDGVGNYSPGPSDELVVYAAPC